MKQPARLNTSGNTLLVALATILILSAVGANVLGNLTTRYNVSTTQVRGWKQAQHAAEAAGDIAYNEIRKTVLDPTNAFAGWTQNGSTYTSPVTTFSDDNLVGSATVDAFYSDPVTGTPWYRIRARGTAPLRGLKRVGMDDRMGPNTRGDSLLRKIDFYYDHFIAAYGPNGDGVGRANVAVASPQLTRRIELIASPVTPFDVAIKAQNLFYGLGNAARIDSFDSANGPYYFCANNPSDPLFADSRSGHVQIGVAVAEVRGMLYGDLSTNGGTIVRSTYVTGTIDNNVPFTLPPFRMPAFPAPQSSPTSVGSATIIDPPGPGTPVAPTHYFVSSIPNNGNLTIMPAANANGSTTYVTVRVATDILGAITVQPGVRAQVYFEGNMMMKARDMVNLSGIAGNLQFYGISPANPATIQQVNIDSGGGSGAGFAATIYAPSAAYTMNGGPDITGALVCKTFYGNGNTTWHYDRALDKEGRALDYRIASYVEDTR